MPRSPLKQKHDEATRAAIHEVAYRKHLQELTGAVSIYYQQLMLFTGIDARTQEALTAMVKRSDASKSLLRQTGGE